MKYMWILTNVYVHGVPIIIKMWTISIAAKSSATSSVTQSPNPHLAQGNHWPAFWLKDLIYQFWNFFEMESYNICCSVCLFLSPVFLLHFSQACSISGWVGEARIAVGRPVNLPCSSCTFGLIPVTA